MLKPTLDLVETLVVKVDLALGVLISLESAEERLLLEQVLVDWSLSHTFRPGFPSLAVSLEIGKKVYLPPVCHRKTF